MKIPRLFTFQDWRILGFFEPAFKWALLLLFFMNIQMSNAQVVINEILVGGTVELKNTGNTTVDVSSYWLCNFPDYDRLQDLNIVCEGGDYMLEPGEILAVDGFSEITIPGNDGEMGLYVNSAFGNVNSIIDYVEWGSTGHVRSGLAVEAGLWTTGDFVPAFNIGQSIASSGMGSGATEWTAGDPSICQENNGTGCDVMIGDITLTDGSTSTSICVDGNPDPLDVITNGGSDVSRGWIITDDAGNILALPMAPPFDLDGAGVGICEIWYVRYETIEGNEVGNNLTDLTGCFALSNPITVTREPPDGGMVSLTDGSTFYMGTAGDIVVEVMHETDAPNLSYWYIITDINDNILAFMNSANGNMLDLSGAPVGECHIWGWSYRGLPNPVVGDHISTLNDDDCEEISENFIRVNRQPADCDVVVNDISLADGNTSTSICVDGNADPLDVITNGGSDVSRGWIITDDAGNILALPMAPPFDLDGAGVGVCEIWYVRYETIGGNVVGNNLTDLTGCFALSNPIVVSREAADGGTVSLEDGSTSAVICVDGNPDPLVVLHQNESPSLTYNYVITDDQDNILAITTSNTIDLDGAGVGVCRIWGWSYRGLNAEDFIGLPLADLQAADCSDISENFVEVIREAPDGGTVSLADGSTFYMGTAGDIMIEVMHQTDAPNLSYWYIITDINDNILAFMNSANGNMLDLSGAPVGECHVWGWSYRGLPNPVIGDHISTLNDDDCEEISENFIRVNRQSADCDVVVNDISLADGSTSTSICVDGNADPLDVITNGGSDVSRGWIITDDAGNILALPMAPPFDLDGAGVGVCEIWYVRYESITGNEVGNNLTDLGGCFALSNPITVIREAPDGGTVSLADGSTFYMGTAGDIVIEVTHQTDAPNLSYWYIITDINDNILAFMNSANGNMLDLSGAPVGECHVWGWSYRGLPNPVIGDHISTLNDDDCEEISENFIRVNRQSADCDVVVNDISLADGTTSTSICVDGNADPLDVITNGGSDVSRGWIITDDAGNILALPMAPPFDLDGAGVGVCEIWYVRYETIGGNVVGNNLTDLTGCFALSNPIVVSREVADGGTVSLEDGSTSAVICVDGNPDPLVVVHENDSPNLTYNYVITDDQDNILAITTSNTIDLDGAGVGVCRIWGWSYRGLNAEDFIGLPLADLQAADCSDISENFINVIREAPDGGTVSLADGSTFYMGTAGDIMIEVMHQTDAPNLSYWYIITDINDNILAFMNSANGNMLDLSGAPVGECHVWGWSYRGLPNPVIGDHISTLNDDDCEEISENFIRVNRQSADCDVVVNDISLADGTTSTSICVDGNPDPLDVITNGGSDVSRGWIITDDAGNILALPMAPPFDLDGAGVGVCEIWYVRYETIGGNVVGNNLTDLTGCFALSNPIVVSREAADGGTVSLEDGSTSAVICVDGNPDPLVVVHENDSPNLTYNYVITDDQDNILAITTSNTIDLDGAGVGVCRIWGWSYRGLNAEDFIGLPLADLQAADCSDISENFINVIREAPDGGTVSLADGSTFYMGTAGDIMIEVMHQTDAPNLSYWYIITDINDNILAFMNSANGNMLDLSGAPVGECHVWGWSYRGLPNPVIGDHISTLNDDDCEEISENFIRVNRQSADCDVVVNDISLADGSTSTSICVDGNADPLDVITNGGSDVSRGWIITDDAGNILALPMAPPFDLDGAGVGICEIWYVRYDSIGGNEVGNNLTDLTGCFALSNPITVIREAADGGTVSLADGSTSAVICVDGNPDPLVVLHQNDSPNLTYNYVITDDQDNILAITNSNTIDLDGAGVGVCRIWGWSYRGLNAEDFIGLPLADLQAADCSDISENFIEVIRQAPDGGMVDSEFGAEVTICVDSIPDPILVSHTTTADRLSYWYIITDSDEENTILGFTTDNEIDLNGAGVGTCRIWGWSYRGLPDPVIGAPLASLMDDDCEDISENFITVIRTDNGPACITSTFEQESVSTLKVYPNPANNFVQVNYEGLKQNAGFLTLLDISGKIIQRIELNNTDDNIRLDISNVQNGYYLIRIDNGQQTSTEKLVILK